MHHPLFLLSSSSTALAEQQREEPGQLDQGEGVPLENLEPVVLVHGEQAAACDLAEQVGERGALEAEDGGEVAGQPGQVRSGAENSFVADD